MFRPAFALVPLLVAAAGVPVHAQSNVAPGPKGADRSPPTADSLAAISGRGRALAERDSVAWLGVGAMTSLSLPPDSMRRFLTRHTDRGWEVAAGTLSARADTFYVAYVSTPGMQPGQWAVAVLDPPRPDTGEFARAARAVETSIAMFRAPARRPYIATAVPAADGPWWVYLYPAPRQEGVWPRGGDTRFRVSADGRVITEKRRLHDSITEYSARTARSATADPRSIAVGDAPEDTDVFHVLQRRPALPELISAGGFRYRIDVGGSIRLIGSR